MATIPEKELTWWEAVKWSLKGRKAALLPDVIIFAVVLVELLTQYASLTDSWRLPALGVVMIFTLIEFHWVGEEVYDYHTYAVLMRHNEKARALLSSSWNSPSFWDRFFIVTFYGGFVFLLVKNIDDSWTWEQLFWCELGAAALAYVVRLRWRIWLHGRALTLA
jgi:hypothetical protein